MCIIVYKPKGEKIPAREILQRCFNNNDDGGGYMFADVKQNAVIIRKGFIDFNKMYKQLKDDAKMYDLRSKALVLHFRIGTSGGLTKNKTHPFILTNKSKLINKYNGDALTCDAAVVHNGVLSNYVYGGLSDTQNFIKDFLYDVYYSNLKDNIKNKVIKNELDGNKLIILNAAGSIKKYGDFIYDNGVYYSNSSYKERYYYTTKNYTSYYDKYYDLKETSAADVISSENDTINDFYKYVKDNYKKITSNTFYCDGYFIDNRDDFDYYVNEMNGDIYEINDFYKTASYIGNNYF